MQSRTRTLNFITVSSQDQQSSGPTNFQFSNNKKLGITKESLALLTLRLEGDSQQGERLQITDVDDIKNTSHAFCDFEINTKAASPFQKITQPCDTVVQKVDLLNRLRKLAQIKRQSKAKRFSQFLIENWAKQPSDSIIRKNEVLKKQLFKASNCLKSHNYFKALCCFNKAFNSLGFEDSFVQVCRSTSIDSQTYECLLYIASGTATCYYKLQQQDQALEHINQIFQVEPNFEDNLFLKCKVLIQLVSEESSDRSSSESQRSTKSLSSTEALKLCNSTLNLLERLIFSKTVAQSLSIEASTSASANKRSCSVWSDNKLESVDLTLKLSSTGQNSIKTEDTPLQQNTSIQKGCAKKLNWLKWIKTLMTILALIKLFKSKIMRKLFDLVLRFIKTRFFFAFKVDQRLL